jgi:hypothetical protein
MATALYRQNMANISNQPRPLGGIPTPGAISPAAPVPHGADVSGQAVHQLVGSATTTGTKFTPAPVFAHWANLMGKTGARNMSLQERRTRSKQQGPDRSRRAKNGATDDAVDPVSGRVRAADVALALDLLRNDSGDGQRNHLEEELKTRKLDRKHRLHVYIKAAENAEQADLLPEDLHRVKQALKKLAQGIQSQNRHELRSAMHDPEKLREAIEAIAGPIEKLTEGMRRELRSYVGPDRPHTEIHRVDVPFQALSMLKFTIALAGPEGCMKALAAYRALWRSGY